MEDPIDPSPSKKGGRSLTGNIEFRGDFISRGKREGRGMGRAFSGRSVRGYKGNSSHEESRPGV